MLIRKLTVIALFMGCGVAHAADIAGKTMLVVGAVNASDIKTNVKRKLKRRTAVFGQDLITTGDKAKAQLRMSDGGLIALKANSELKIADYQYSDESGKGSVVMELVKGGLRSVTGNIKAQNGDYRLKTPVGSIGIRGTHYEVELVAKEMFIAVWDGAVDVSIGVGDEPGRQVSFGAGEAFSYASISSTGKVTMLLEPPKNFNSGMSTTAGTAEESSEEAENSEEVTSNDEPSDNSEEETTEVAQTSNSQSSDAAVPEANDIGQDTEMTAGDGQFTEIAVDLAEDGSYLATDEFNTAQPKTAEQLLPDRSGKLTYNNAELLDGNSTAGGLKNFQMSMDIDFDTLGVTAGNLTLDDNEGEWRATFSGNISTSGQIALDISHASHGNNLADGEIDTAFYDGLDSIIGNFELEEVLRPNINTTGSFIIK
ncbi:FecR family protein [Psychrosphaera sp. 1_MG-2023]|uniref:FecR family protein n=1 Tax=Psychrosphaera sp. 1_MG-2023 TaxID=3062643 RepID=UPI0026E47574|nr:FecR family protein [Psychrosphaera sp. 1_MG-2023]MDO6719739.1 FecR family protein [Psychrosphaera sp. 1_MG-2023]